MRFVFCIFQQAFSDRALVNAIHVDTIENDSPKIHGCPAKLSGPVLAADA